MNVQVAHCLPCSSAIVDANVVPGRAELRVKLLLRRLEQCEHCRALARSDVKERGHMPDWDHKRVTWADGVGIAKCEREAIAYQYALRRQRAEGASGAVVHTARVQVSALSCAPDDHSLHGDIARRTDQMDLSHSRQTARRTVASVTYRSPPAYPSTARNWNQPLCRRANWNAC